jgi:hypothetical protein
MAFNKFNTCDEGMAEFVSNYHNCEANKKVAEVVRKKNTDDYSVFFPETEVLPENWEIIS